MFVPQEAEDLRRPEKSWEGLRGGRGNEILSSELGAMPCTEARLKTSTISGTQRRLLNVVELWSNTTFQFGFVGQHEEVWVCFMWETGSAVQSWIRVGWGCTPGSCEMWCRGSNQWSGCQWLWERKKHGKPKLQTRRYNTWRRVFFFSPRRISKSRWYFQSFPAEFGKYHRLISTCCRALIFFCWICPAKIPYKQPRQIEPRYGQSPKGCQSVHVKVGSPALAWSFYISLWV